MTYSGVHGSCKNPYAGRTNPSKIDFAAWVTNPECINSGAPTGLELFALTQIAHAAADYLFYGLGRNGYTISKWFEAFEFFWRTRSFKPETWQDSPKIKTVIIDSLGKRNTVLISPDTETLKLQCFDRYYDLSGFSRQIPMDTFLEYLLKTRKSIIYKSKEQVKEYFGQIEDDDSIESNLLKTLVWPESPSKVEEIIVPYVIKGSLDKSLCKALNSRKKKPSDEQAFSFNELLEENNETETIDDSLLGSDNSDNG